jgi:hypothetical protein
MDYFMKTVPLCIVVFGIVIFMLALFFPAITPFLGKLIVQLDDQPSMIDNRMLQLGRVIFTISLRVFLASFTAVIYVAIMMGCWQVVMCEIIFSLRTITSAMNEMNHGMFWSGGTKQIPLVTRNVSLLNKLQIFSTCFNSIYETRFFIYVLGLAQATMIVGGYSVMKYGSNVPTIIAVGLYAITAMKYIIAGMFLTMSASVYEKSKAEIEKMQHLVSSTGNQIKYKKMLLKSLRPLKVKIGSVNFVDKMTPVVILCYVVEQTISLVIM